MSALLLHFRHRRRSAEYRQAYGRHPQAEENTSDFRNQVGEKNLWFHDHKKKSETCRLHRYVNRCARRVTAIQGNTTNSGRFDALNHLSRLEPFRSKRNKRPGGGSATPPACESGDRSREPSGNWCGRRPGGGGLSCVGRLRDAAKRRGHPPTRRVQGRERDYGL